MAVKTTLFRFCLLAAIAWFAFLPATSILAELDADASGPGVETSEPIEAAQGETAGQTLSVREILTISGWPMCDWLCLRRRWDGSALMRRRSRLPPDPPAAE